MILEKNSSFRNSILHKISQETWRRGAANFFIEAVPFSFSTGHEYANYCSRIFNAAQSQYSNTVKITEIGAGLGMFSKKIIQACQSQKMDFQYCLTEYSQTLTDKLKEQGFVKQQPQQVSCETVQLETLNFSEPPHIIILNYVLDTMPVNCLHLKEGELYEWVVTTSLKKGATILDTTCYPFKEMRSKAIQTFLEHKIPDEKLPLLSRISSLIHTEWKLVKRQISDIDSSGVLEEFIAECPYDMDFSFNFSPDLPKVIDNLVKGGQENALILMHDFAQLTPEQGVSVGNCYGQFRACLCYRVPFFFMDYYCKKNGINFLHSSYTDSENQVGIMTTINDNKTLSTIADILGEPEVGMEVQKAIDELTTCKSYKHTISCMKEFSSTLTPEQQKDYVYIVSLAKSLAIYQKPVEAITVLKPLIEDYGVAALNAIVLQAKCYRMLEQREDALNVLNKAIEFAPQYELLHLEKACVEFDLKKEKAFQESLQNYFKFSTLNPKLELEELAWGLDKKDWVTG